MEAIMFAIIAYFGWGSGVFAETIAARRIKPLSFAVWGFAASLILTGWYIPFAWKDLFAYTVPLLALNIALGAGGMLFGIISYYEALQIENRALVGTIASSFPIVTVLLSVLLFGERITGMQLLAIGLVFSGIFISTVEPEALGRRKAFLTRGVALAFLTMMVWGTWYALIKILVVRVGWFWPNYLSFLTFPVIFLVMRRRHERLEPLTSRGFFVPFLISTVLVRIAEFAYNFGISHGAVAVVAPIAGANPTLFILLAFLFLKDPLGKRQIIGILLTIAGIAALSAVSI
ncbi:DMT family transporter [Patescibacteria group bacterium]|nr:DMT family transporter [Patescibacteria group bacterium]